MRVSMSKQKLAPQGVLATARSSEKSTFAPTSDIGSALFHRVAPSWGSCRREWRKDDDEPQGPGTWRADQGDGPGLLIDAPEPTQWDAGGLTVVTPRVVPAWKGFAETPTKFVFGVDW